MAAFDGAETEGRPPVPGALGPMGPPGCGGIDPGLIEVFDGAVGGGGPPGAPGPPGCGNAVRVEGVVGASVVEGVFCCGGAPGLVSAP
ncbi:MAG TPA: hypothetical protein VF866_05910 [Xanthobacteraceae bacterium]